MSRMPMRCEMIHGFQRFTVVLDKEELERIRRFLSEHPSAYRSPYSKPEKKVEGG